MNETRPPKLVVEFDRLQIRVTALCLSFVMCQVLTYCRSNSHLLTVNCIELQLGTLPISARLWDSPRQTAIEITDAVQYNYLNQDPTPLPNNIHGTQTSNADTQAGIDLMRYQQTNHLMRTSQGQLSDHLMRTSPALLTNPGIPSSLLDAEALNSLLSGDMPPPPAPSSGPLSYEQMRQNAGGLYGQYGDRGLGNPYGLPSTHLTRFEPASKMCK